MDVWIIFLPKNYKAISIFSTFSQNNSNTVLKSKVICVETLGLELKNLSNLLVIMFTVNSSEIIHVSDHLYCIYLSDHSIVILRILSWVMAFFPLTEKSHDSNMKLTHMVWESLYFMLQTFIKKNFYTWFIYCSNVIFFLHM